jgi:hypothetical protein
MRLSSPGTPAKLTTNGSVIPPNLKSATAARLARPASGWPVSKLPGKRRRARPDCSARPAFVSLSCRVAVQHSQPLHYPDVAGSAVRSTVTAPDLVLLVAGFEKYQEAERFLHRKDPVLM